MGYFSFMIGQDMSYLELVREKLDRLNPKLSEERVDYINKQIRIAFSIVVINSIILVPLMFYSVRVIRVTKCKNIRHTLLMILMILSVISDIYKRTFLMYDYHLKLENNFYKRNHLAFEYAFTVPDLLLKLAILINFNNWVLYYFVIQEQV